MQNYNPPIPFRYCDEAHLPAVTEFRRTLIVIHLLLLPRWVCGTSILALPGHMHSRFVQQRELLIGYTKVRWNS